MISEKLYWIILVLGLGIFTVVDWIWIIPISWDIGINLFTDSIFMLFTVIFLTWLFKKREQREWVVACKHVHLLIGTETRHLYNVLEILFEPRPRQLGLFYQEFLRNLKELSDREELKLSSVGKKAISTKHKAAILKEIRKSLSDIEVKYSRFLNPSLLDSLLSIQVHLNFIIDHITNKEMYLEMFSEERYFSILSNAIHDIIKKVTEIHMMDDISETQVL